MAQSKISTKFTKQQTELIEEIEPPLMMSNYPYKAKPQTK